MTYMVKVGALDGFSEQLLELGGIPETLFQLAGLQPADLEDAENWIPYRSFLKLLNLAAEHTRCETFGLKMSQKQRIKGLGAVGLIMHEAPDIRSALREFISYFHLHNQGATIELKVIAELAYLSFNIHESGEVNTRQQECLAAGIGSNILSMLCGNHGAPQRFYFTHSEPKDINAYQKTLRAPCHFNEEFHAVLFKADLLDVKLTNSNEQLHEILLQHLGLQAKQSPTDFIDNIKKLITKAMLEGDSSIDQVASYMAINKRTLQRQLKGRELSFKNLLEQVRYDTATKYLPESKISLTQISDILCYADISAFSRAFKRTCGISPQKWRLSQTER